MDHIISYDLIKDAYIKLSTNIYFDKQNLHLRNQLARFINNDVEKRLLKLQKLLNNKTPNFKSYLKDNVNVILLPKSVKENPNTIDSELTPPNFYTNQNFKEPALVEKMAVFIDVPIEIHLISTLWVMKYGRFLDAELDLNCTGNRLHLNGKQEIVSGRILFHKYEKQYQLWWSKGIEAAKELFDKKEDVTILNFDFKDYYHTIKIDFEKLRKHISNKLDMEGDYLFQAFEEIHIEYLSKLKLLGFSLLDNNQQFPPLPIGLLSSSILANWYLKDFDKQIKEELNPVYYGRYVDDLMIVVKDTVIKKYDKGTNKNHKNILQYYIDKYFKKIFSYNKETDTYSLALKDLNKIQLQPEKFFIYQFDAEFSPHLLNRFVEDQRERVSAFQFLSEDDDNSFKDLDEITFELSFDESEVSKSKLKNVDDNKFKLSVYLSKLIRGSVISGNSYNESEYYKVKKFFKGYFLIRNYYFWEKLFTLYIVRKDVYSFFKLYTDIKHEINEILLVDSANKFDKIKIDEVRQNLKDHLNQYLDNAFVMSAGLWPGVISESRLNSKDRNNFLQTMNFKLYRKSGLLRKNNVFYPLLQYTEFGRNGNDALFDKGFLGNFFNSSENLDGEILEDWIPFRVKFFEVCLVHYYSILKKYNVKLPADSHRHIEKFWRSDDVLRDSFKLFYKLNHLYSPIDEIQSEYFKIIETPTLPTANDLKLNAIEIKIPNSGKIKEKLRIGLVNKYVDLADFENSLEGNPNDGPDRFEDFNRIIDDIRKVKKCDLFIMPELCLPHIFIPYYTLQSASRQTAFTTGIEHWGIGQLAFNFIYSVYPINVYGDFDAIPILRIKNHYSHEEEKWINDKHMIVPKPNPYHYELIEWRSVYMSNYYCFELADINHRHIFYGKLDVIFTPVWNADMHYFNSILEACSRDIHCFIVLANTTQYGDSRIIRPADHINRDKVRVKGGTVKDYKANILVSDLEVKKLRYFQTIDYSGFSDVNKKNKTYFKPLPPDYPYELAIRRLKNKLFE